MRETTASRISFWLHVPIFLLVLLPFFVPTALWPSVVQYHFWYVVALYILGYGTGLIYYPLSRQILFMCPLTLLTQVLRGYSWRSSVTYRASFIGELWERMGFVRLEKNKSNFNTASLIMHSMLVLVSLQYFFGILVF